MSDSDDTEVLLLIPPDFFLLETNREDNKYCVKNNSLHPMSDALYLGPCQQFELDNINERLLELDISSISARSNYTIRTNNDCDKSFSQNSNLENENISKRFAQSTPKYSLKPPSETIGMLKEIDSFLEKKPTQNLDNSLFSQLSQKPHFDGKKDIVSLSEIWNNDKQMESTTLQEEQYRRKHCEKAIQALQVKLLEYQQKLSIAIEVDKTKDLTLARHKDEIFRLKSKLSIVSQEKYHLETNKSELISRLQTENADLKSRKDFLENELKENLNLLSKFQNKSDELEIKMEDIKRSSVKADILSKKQIEDLGNIISSYERSEEMAKNNLKKTQNELNNIMSGYEKSEKEITELKKLMELQKEKFDQEKHRGDQLEIQNKTLQENFVSQILKEKNLQQELNVQRTTLKIHYQQQLEEVVSEKLKEFQSQLDSVEDTLKLEAKEREKLIIEKAIKQIELINEKSEQEISLMQQKQKEEIELYRIQLINASKKINDLTDKVNSYKSKRTDMAKKIHCVMETQWQKALEILTNPKTNMTDHFTDYVKEQEQCPYQICENESTITNSHKQNDNIDQIHAYIQLLLKKSPKDLEMLDVVKKPKNFTKTGTNNRNCQLEPIPTKAPWK